MNPHRLPPLNALRAFTVAARHGSLSRAAEELHVTPAAVSHQVKALEDQLDIALFIRGHRSLTLTEAGRALLPGLQAGFEQLAEAVARLHALRSDRPLTVSANMSFCGKWLIPHLDRFRRLHPDIDIRLDASNELTDFATDGVDVAIRYGGGAYPGLASHRLWPAQVFPVCSPRLPTPERPLAKPEDLRHHTLLHADWFAHSVAWPDWRMWLKSAGVANVDGSRGLQFNQTAHAIQAAVEGHGVALASSLLVADDLAAGRLVRPFELTVDVDFTFYLVYPRARAEDPKVVAFRDWLLDAVARERPPGGAA